MKDKIIRISLVAGLLALLCSFTATLKANDLYVSGFWGYTVGAYTTGGATVNASLISGLANPWGIAISGNDLFVVNNGNGTVGEYTIAGATINASLITGLSNPRSIAISGNNLFVANEGNEIGRAHV